MFKRILIVGLACAVLGLSAARSQANVVFQLGNNPQTDENVLMNKGSSGSTVFGDTNQSHTTVQFDSATDMLNEPSNGQARIEASDQLLNNIKITIPSGSFYSLIANPKDGYEGSDKKNPQVNTLNIVVKTVDAQTFNFSESIANGNNFFTLIADGGTEIASVELSSSLGFTDLRQVRIGTGTFVPTPVAASSGLLVLVALGAIKARKLLMA